MTVSESATPPDAVVYAGPASAWPGAEAPLHVDDSLLGLDLEGRESMLRWACRATVADSDRDPWWLLDQLAVDHEHDPAGLSQAISDLVRQLDLAAGLPCRAGYRWSPEGLRRDTPFRTLTTWRWFATRLLDELARRRVKAAADAITTERRQAALAAYHHSQAAERSSGSGLSRAERRFVVAYYFLADGHVAERVAATPTEREVREAVGQQGYQGDGWAWDTTANRHLGVRVTHTPDGHAGTIPWRELLDQALATSGLVQAQTTLF